MRVSASFAMERREPILAHSDPQLTARRWPASRDGEMWGWECRSVELRIGLVIARGLKLRHRLAVIRRAGATGDARRATARALLARVLMGAVAEVDNDSRVSLAALGARALGLELRADRQQVLDLARGESQRLAARDPALEFADGVRPDGLTAAAERDLAAAHRQPVPGALLPEPLFFDHVVGLSPEGLKPAARPALDILGGAT